MRSNSLWCLIAIASASLIGGGAKAQDDRAQAIDLYNAATRDESDALRSRETGEAVAVFEARSLSCLSRALRSYGLYASKLAAWRVASCAAGANAWALAYVAQGVFRQLEPEGLETWTHASIDERELTRVRQLVAQINSRVGLLSAQSIPAEGATWRQPAQRIPLAVGEMPTEAIVGASLAQLQATAYLLPQGLVAAAGAFVSVTLTAPDGYSDRVTTHLLSLSEGVTVLRTPPAVPTGPQGGDGPATPSRSDVARALQQPIAPIRACGQAASLHGRVAVTVTFEGSTGRVYSVDFGAQLPSSVRACIERAVRDVRIPTFAEPTFRVSSLYSY